MRFWRAARIITPAEMVARPPLPLSLPPSLSPSLPSNGGLPLPGKCWLLVHCTPYGEAQLPRRPTNDERTVGRTPDGRHDRRVDGSLADAAADRPRPASTDRRRETAETPGLDVAANLAATLPSEPRPIIPSRVAFYCLYVLYVHAADHEITFPHAQSPIIFELRPSWRKGAGLA